MKAKQIIDHIVKWLAAYCDRSGLNGFLIGVSGGVDSAVTSTLCAITGRPVIALNMPIYQARDQESLAALHINWLETRFPNVQGKRIDLTPPFQALEAVLPTSVAQNRLTMANTRSRMRMMTLYAFAGHHRMIVAGTGNKVEDFGVGFYTKYGDGGVDLSPIADLLKSEVYVLAAELEINPSILEAPPTDGLWDDHRTDEHQIGATYAELEWAMKERKKGVSTGDLTERQKKVLAIYNDFHNANRHKMDPIPVCIIPKELKEGGR